MNPPEQVREVDVHAAGGVVWRPAGADGGIEVLVIHRPRYDDWSFPKGKCDPGEDFATTAARELHEETGFVVAFGPYLDDLYYRDHKQRTKVVRYWAMTVASGAFEVNEEVDEIAWLDVAAAQERLTYEHDRDLLRVLLAVT